MIICGFAACNDDFMERVPKTSITAPAFFKSVTDMQLYVNGIYEAMIPNGTYGDFASDNVTVRVGEDPYASLLYGRTSKENIGGWDGWDKLRRVNLMLNSVDESAVSGMTGGSEADVKSLLGIARYFRARFYIDKVQTYSDVPWYDVVIESSDEDLLYKAQDPRETVVEKIMEDLEYAAENIKPDLGNRTRVHKYVALAEISRFCLYEGTYRKYHSEIGLASSANRFLERAVSASLEIINSGEFEITGGGTNVELAPGITGSTGFRAMFCSSKLGDNREMIQWSEYDYNNNRRHNADVLLKDNGTRYSLSRSLQESFLTKDGKPFSTVAGYATKEYGEVFVDRDPRMGSTFAYPGVNEENMVNGQPTGEITEVYQVWPNCGGYEMVKFYYQYKMDELKSPTGIGMFTSLPVFRLGEILLNYAEAKAELGKFGEADGTVTPAGVINMLRDRVAMPHFNASVEVDQTLRDLYPGVTDNNILAVRRERRVELAGEGLRRHDMNRWYAGKLFEHATTMQGIYVPRLPYVYDVTGDGVPDVGIAANTDSRTGDANILWYDLDDANVSFYLENGTSGYVRYKDDAARRFVEPKYYYSPIPIGQTVLNPNLTQPYGWDD
jgi:hypothetical protein